MAKEAIQVRLRQRDLMATSDFIGILEAKVIEQLKSQRVGFLLGAGSSYLDNAGYPLASELWDFIKDRITDLQKRDEIQAKLDGGTMGIEHALDLLDDGGATDTPYRHLVTAAIAEVFLPKAPSLDQHMEFVRRLAQRGDPCVKVFNLNYDPLIERAAEAAKVRIADGDIARKIVGALKLTLYKEPALRRYTASLESYARYMKGIYFYNKRGQENLEKALGFFGSAIELDPKYALAHAWIAETYTVIGSWAYLPPREAFSKAREAALRALRIDDTLAEAHSALADVTYLYDWEWDKAEAEYERALAGNPNYAVAHSSYAQFLACQARFDESLEQHWRARGLDPLSLMIRSTMANTLVWMGRYDEAESELGQVLEMDPGYEPALEYLHTKPASEDRLRERISRAPSRNPGKPATRSARASPTPGWATSPKP